ncbi:MAG: alpha/beta hydrolase [Sphingomicrobium sp.]
MKTKTFADTLRDSSTGLSSPAAVALAASGAATAGLAVFNAVRARRANRANPATGAFVTVSGVKLHYVAIGEGPTVVLLHGNGMMIEDWTASGVLGELAKTNRVIAFDRPGFGHSERPRSTVWTPVAQAKLIAEALNELGEKDVSVVGHSFGTLVALALAAERPALVSSLVLISGYYYPSARLDVVLAAPPAVPVIGDVIRYTASPLLGAALKPRMEQQMFGPARVSDGWRKDFPFEMTLRPSQVRAAAADAALMIPAAAAAAAGYADLAMPVTIIAGTGDKVVDPKSQSCRLAGEIDDSELLLIEHAGHMVHHSAAEAVVGAIRAR